MQKIRMGIVGLGIMGRRYYTMLRALAGVEVTALCVRHLDTIHDLAGAKFADYRRLFASGQIDAVIIATPHYRYPQVAIAALHCGSGKAPLSMAIGSALSDQVPPRVCASPKSIWGICRRACTSA